MRRFFLVVFFLLLIPSVAQAQGAKQAVPQTRISDPDGDHVKQRAEWFYRGRVVRGEPSAELRHRAYQAKLQMHAQRASALMVEPHGQPSFSVGSWMPLGPVPLASDASGNGTQDYHQVAGRATAVAIDPADPTGNTIYLGGAQSGVWKSTNAANSSANAVTWTPLTDAQATLSIGAIAIQPGNSDPTKTVILAATGEADSSGDSYFGLGILRSADAGRTWTLISKANNQTLSFAGLGGTRMAFSTATAQTSTAVAAMATTSEGLVDGAATSGTTRGLYTSLDAGLSWTYDALTDAGIATDATSATSVVYNKSAGQFFAAIRYHGFYSSPDGVNWARLASQPGGAALSTSSCPPQSTSNNQGCPIYRGEIAVVPGRKEMYAWYIYFGSDGSTTDEGIWQSLDGGATWNPISDTGITNCGDNEGCGVEQGAYDLELLALNSGSGTDVYAGAVNLYKCSINSSNPACASAPFMNLTHAYGCVPAGAPAHVHPDQHALAATIPANGSGNALMYFANDGGVYRSLAGFTGLNSGSCTATNQFDDLNQNLGSMTQFVGFSQHPTDPNTVLGGAQDNGSPATNQATTNRSWTNVLGGDGGYNIIDPSAPTNWYATNPDVPPGGLGIQFCSAGINCNNGGFGFVVTSGSLGGDDGGFYFPYILDPSSSTTMLVGTCRVWRGPKTGGIFTELSPNFDTLGSGTCSGNEINQVRALAVGGLSDANGSSVIYATTSGLGPLDGPGGGISGGRVWVTTNASAGVSAFVDVTGNGLQGSINPNQFPLSAVAVDPTDATGNTAYVTVMGFTGGPGHVWKTTNAGASWTDFTGNLFDSPVNAVVVYSPMSQIFVATDVGVFASSTSSASWTELGPNPSSNQAGFLPNVAVTALGVFASGGQQLLRASTYGRGIWQFNLVITPDFQLAISPNSAQTVFAAQTATFGGTVTEVNGYGSSIAVSCVSGATAAPSSCSSTPATLSPASTAAFTVTAGGAAGDYNFNVQALGSDANHVAHKVPVTLHIVNLAMSNPSPSTVSVPRGTSSSSVNFQITAAGSFNQSVTVSCSTTIPSATCSLTPGSVMNPTSSSPANMAVTIAVPAVTPPGNYSASLQATSPGLPFPLSTSFTLNVTANPDFVLTEPAAFPEVNAGGSGMTGSISITAQDGFSGSVTLSCPTTYGAGSCSISPGTVSSFPATATLTIFGVKFTAGAYSLLITGTSGSVVHTLAVPFNVGDYAISGTQNVSAVAGGQVIATFKLASLSAYTGKINANCDASALAGAMCSMSPPNPIAVSSSGSTNLAVSVNVPQNAAPGTYNIKISTQDTSGSPNHAATFSLTINPDFVINSQTAVQYVQAGQTTGAYQLSVRPVGVSFSAPITLSCSGLPSGARCLFSPSGPITPNSSAVDIVMSIATGSAKGKILRSNGRLTALYLSLFVFPGIAIAWLASGERGPRRKPCLRAFASFGIVLSIAVFLSCSGVSSSGGGGGGGGSTCSAVPSVPTGLAASSTTSTSTALNWTASTAASGCSLTGYTVYKNGSAVATTATNTYSTNTLAPSTVYTFAVAASDSYGTSAPSSSIGIDPVTVTGTSPGTQPDAGQSTQVILVVN